MLISLLNFLFGGTPALSIVAWVIAVVVLAVASRTFTRFILVPIAQWSQVRLHALSLAAKFVNHLQIDLFVIFGFSHIRHVLIGPIMLCSLVASVPWFISVPTYKLLSLLALKYFVARILSSTCWFRSARNRWSKLKLLYWKLWYKLLLLLIIAGKICLEIFQVITNWFLWWSWIETLSSGIW